MYGVFIIIFDQDIVYPEGIEKWTSQNQGAQYFDIIYLPSAESKTFFDEAGIENQM